MAILRTENVSVAFQNKVVLDNISLTFPEGKITAVLGPNGCGKSTLLKVMAGIQQNYHGNVFLDNKMLRKFSAKHIARHMAVLPQTVTVPSDLNVRQLVSYGRFPYRSIFKSGGKEDTKIIEWAMNETGMTEFADRQINSLSGGERQRAWIAMALCQQPEVLLLDEPTTYLDIAHQLEVMKIIAMLNKHRHMTVIMVLHDINHARIYADNAVVIKNHKAFAQGAPTKVLCLQNLAEVFNVKAQTYYNNSEKNNEIIFPADLVK